MLSKEEILNRMGNKGMFEVYLHGDWSKVDSKIGINIKNAWSRESKSHGECELIVLSKTVYVEWDHLIHRKAVPLSLKGKGNSVFEWGRGFPYRARHFHLAASEALPRSRRGEAHRRQGWVGGVYPSAQIQGADSGFRRKYGIHPRRAKRRA